MKAQIVSTSTVKIKICLVGPNGKKNELAGLVCPTEAHPTAKPSLGTSEYLQERCLVQRVECFVFDHHHHVGRFWWLLRSSFVL